MNSADISVTRSAYEKTPSGNVLGLPVVPGRVSVIIAVFQGERFIEGAIYSALAQSHKEIEVIVVDDGSTDSTLDLVSAISDPRLVVLRQPNKGAAAARNLGLRKATGEYIACLDADDRWFPQKLEIEIATLVASKEPVGIAYSRYYAVDALGRVMNRSKGVQRSGNVFDVMLREEFDIMTSICLFHRGVFETLGGFDEGRRLHEDGAFMLKATKLFPVFPSGRYLVVYQQTTDGKCRRALADFETAWQAQMSIVEDFKAEINAEQEKVFRWRQTRALLSRFLMYGYNESARRMLSNIDLSALRRGKKGWLAWFFAKTRVNLMYTSRILIQGTIRICFQWAWRRLLRKNNLVLRYGSPIARRPMVQTNPRR